MATGGYKKYWSTHTHPTGKASGYGRYWSRHTHQKGAKSGYGKWWAKHKGSHVGGWGKHKHVSKRPHIISYHSKQHRIMRKPRVSHAPTSHKNLIHIKRVAPTRGHTHISKLKLYKAYVF